MMMEEEEKQEEEAIIHESEPESMVSVAIGRAMATLLDARSSRKLRDSISQLSRDSSKKPSSLVSLEDSLWFVQNYVKDAADRGGKLDDVLIPLIQHCLRNKDSRSRHGGQEILLIDWLFRDELLFQSVAKELADILSRKEDRFVALGWCVLVRSLVEYERFLDHFTLTGIRENYNALLKILCSCVPRLSCIVCNGCFLQDGFELPSRLAISAADCILALSEALTKKMKVQSNEPKSLNSTTLDRPMALSCAATGEKKVKPTIKPLEVPDIEMAYLLWNQMDELISLLQRLLAWSGKSRPLHAKGVEHVLKWLQEVKEHYSHVCNETGASVLKTGALLLSSCWKHYGLLLHLEDCNFSKHCNELLDRYISGIQYYTDNLAEGHLEKKDGDVETRKFFLNCLCLLLGRFDSRKFEKTVSEYGLQLSRVFLSQLQSADEDIVAGAIFIFKAAIVKPSYVSASSVECRQMDAGFPLLLQLLDERDGTARAVVVLIAEYCSMSTDSHCLEQVLKRLASGNLLQRRNAIDVISEVVCISSDSENKVSHLAWQDIANNLLERLSDEEVVIRREASKLLSRMDPSLFLPALLDLVYSSDEGKQSSASSALIEMLKYHNQKPEVICMLLDCLSNVNQILDTSNATRDVTEGPQKADQVLKLILEWSKSVQDWKFFIGPLIDKMFSEPTNATIVRFLSCISEHLADAADAVLCRILLQMQGQEEWQTESCASEDSAEMRQCLFERLCPLLIIRLLPLRVFDDLKSVVVYGQLSNEGIMYERGDVNTRSQACIAAFLLKRAISKSEFEDVRKLAAELCGRLHPHVLLPAVSTLLEHAADCREVQKVKACLFSVCTSLLVRGKESVYHPAILQIRKIIETILFWPSSDGDEVSKAQHGCIDCLALMICAELQPLGLLKGDSKKSSVGKTGTVASGNSVLAYVICQLVNEENEVVSASTSGSENYPVRRSFRLCMANVLISACQKISDPSKKAFAQKSLPYLIRSVEVIVQPEIRAACVQVMFSAVFHLKSAVCPYSSDLLKLSLGFLGKRSEKERMAGAKLMASLMAGEDEILESISGGLLEARSVLSRISVSDPSQDVQFVCKKLLACITSP